MYKEFTLTNQEKHAHVLIYDTEAQLQDFCFKHGFNHSGASFAYKYIDDNNYAYIFRTKETVTEENVDGAQFLEIILGHLNSFGTSFICGEDKTWSLKYVAKQMGLKISW